MKREYMIATVVVVLFACCVGGCVPLTPDEQAEISEAQETVSVLTATILEIKEDIVAVKEEVDAGKIPIEKGSEIIKKHNEKLSEYKNLLTKTKNIISNTKGKSINYIWQLIFAIVTGGSGLLVGNRGKVKSDAQLASVVVGIDKIEKKFTKARNETTDAGMAVLESVKSAIKQESIMQNVGSDLHNTVRNLT